MQRTLVHTLRVFETAQPCFLFLASELRHVGSLPPFQRPGQWHFCGVAWTHVAPQHHALHLDPEKAQGVGRVFRKVPDEGRLGSGQRHHHTGTARQATFHCATASESSQGLHGTEFHYNSVFCLRRPVHFVICTSAPGSLEP